jgi:LPXTG-site transpeptidase (sortase) family protein
MLRLSTALIVCGLLILGYTGLWQLGLAPGSRVWLPRPVVLERAGAGTREVSAVPTVVLAAAPTLQVLPKATPIARLEPTPIVAPLATTAPPPKPTPVPTLATQVVALQAADAIDRTQAAQLPPPGYAVRLAIPTIKLDTVVKQGGVVPDETGNLIWQTLPFVAVHYGDLTALVGARGNAVIAGHVVTLREGNVFRFLYLVNLDDEILVWDEQGREHDFRVVDVKLVPPTDTSPMGPSVDPTLTLITCGGTFDPVKREFSDRLVVTARSVDSAAAP